MENLDNDEMVRILQQVGLNSCIASFLREKISPDIVCKLSMVELKELGVSNNSEMMNLRLKCIAYREVRNFDNDVKYQISKEIIEFLIDSGFKIREISKLLSVSERTIYRRMSAFNLSVYKFTNIDDETLNAEVKRVTMEFPRIGEMMIKQVLHEKGIKIPRWRLREALRSSDQVGINVRMRGRLHRRVYNVAAPNHLWHIDTNHKLIRWHFIICGGIDGFSRFIVFLRCENNNKADTILRCFLDGTSKYGTPLRVRSDQGMENIKVAEHMIRTRGINKRCMITGKSTHNQRIERLWRDIFEGVLCYYYDLFYFMEDRMILDPLNEVHIFALHYVYTRKINEKLDLWKDAWARHRLRTARSSPLRLFMAGAINCPVDTPLSENDAEYYGVDGNIEIDANQAEDQRPSLSPVVMDMADDGRQTMDDGHS